MVEVIRSDRADEHPLVVWGVVIITFFVFILTGITILWIATVSEIFYPVPDFQGNPTNFFINPPALFLGFIFIGMAAVVDLYRKHFVPDELVSKLRLEKIVHRREFR